MKRLFLLFFFFLLSPLFGLVNENKDFELWIHSPWRFELSPCTRLYADVEGRWADEASTLFQAYGQVRFGVDVIKWLEIAPGYRQFFFLLPSDREWKTIYFPLADALLKFDWCGWNISDRNRVEYLAFEFRDNIWSYRNRIQVIPPWRLGNCKWVPLVSNEVFFRESQGFAQNRFIVGVSLPIESHVKWSPYYLLRHLRLLNGEWIHHNILGLRFHVSY